MRTTPTTWDNFSRHEGVDAHWVVTIGSLVIADIDMSWTTGTGTLKSVSPIRSNVNLWNRKSTTTNVKLTFYNNRQQPNGSRLSDVLPEAIEQSLVSIYIVAGPNATGVTDGVCVFPTVDLRE